MKRRRRFGSRFRRSLAGWRGKIHVREVGSKFHRERRHRLTESRGRGVTEFVITL